MENGALEDSLYPNDVLLVAEIAAASEMTPEYESLHV
jgi:glutathione peroxidase-family protein